MHFLQGRRYSRSNRMMWEGSEQSNSQEQVYKENQNNPNTDWLAQLYASRDRILKFIEDLGVQRETELRQDVTIHCQNNVKNQRNYDMYISSDMISKIVNIRIEKMIKNKRIKKNWSEQDVKILIWLISKYSDLNDYQDVQRDIIDQDWEFIATLIPGVTAESCMFKWLSLKKINLATNNWSQSESILLGNIVRQQAKQSRRNIQIKDWKTVSQKLYKLNDTEDKIFRNAKQCREHWNCYLNPNLKKGPWRPQQDIKLLKKIQDNKGSKKWSQIVRQFDGRTQNALKNRYTLIIDKQKKHNKGKCQLELIEDYLQRCYVQQFTQVIKGQSSDQNDHKSIYSYDDLAKRKTEQDFNNLQNMQTNSNSKKDAYDFHQQKVEQMFPIKEEENIDNGLTTPAKIEKIKFQNFSSFAQRKDMFKFIQPGVIGADGSFKRTDDKPLALRRIQSSYY